MLSVGTTVIGVGDFDRAVAFWTAALDYVPKRPITPDDDFMILVPREGAGAWLALDVSTSPVQEHPRVHLDLENPDFVVLADTEGNRFCVIDTSPGGAT